MSDDLPVRQQPAGTPEIRISDAERERAVVFLRHHCTDGRLTLDEFSDRVGLVFNARTTGDIELVTNDLPAVPGLPSTVALPDTPPDQTARPTRRSRAVRWTVSIFGGNQQKGRWRVEGETTAVSFMGHCNLDLRDAEVVGHEAVINAFAFMGGVDVIVPEGIEVILEGLAIMGAKQSRVKPTPIIPGSPVVRVRAFAFMGGVTVRSRGASSGRSKSKAKAKHQHPHERRDRRDPYDRLERQERRDRRPRPPARAAPPSEPARPAPPAHRVRGIDAVAADVADEWPEVRARVAPEGTVTIMFSDIEGFTSMCEQMGDYRANAILRDHYQLVRDELAKHGGFEVKVHGDGFMVAFSSASRALRCAIAIQRAQRAWNQEHRETEMRVRMGLHTGEAIRDADDFLGTTVNLASRIAAAAGGDEVLVSALLRELCLSSGEFTFDGGAEVELKGISQPQRVFAVEYS